MRSSRNHIDNSGAQIGRCVTDIFGRAFAACPIKTRSNIGHAVTSKNQERYATLTQWHLHPQTRESMQRLLLYLDKRGAGSTMPAAWKGHVRPSWKISDGGYLKFQ